MKIAEDKENERRIEEKLKNAIKKKRQRVGGYRVGKDSCRSVMQYVILRAIYLISCKKMA